MEDISARREAAGWSEISLDVSHPAIYARTEERLRLLRRG